MKHTVSLYRYDLTGGLARQFSAGLLGLHVEGIWHTSVVVYNKEFFFDGGVGIMTDANPGHTRFGTPYKIEILGQTSKSEEEFTEWIHTLTCNNTSPESTSLIFGPDDYDLLSNNCNHFTQAASRFLLNRDIPADIREMIPTLLSTPLGRMLQPMLEQATQGYSNQRSYNALDNTSVVQTHKEASESASQEEVGKGLTSSKSKLSDDEEEDLMTIQAMLESNPLLTDPTTHNVLGKDVISAISGFDLTCKALDVLSSLLQKIISFPDERKYRIVSMSSNTYKSYLLPLEQYGVREVLSLAGFVIRQHQHIGYDVNSKEHKRKVESTEEVNTAWVLIDEKGSADVLQRILYAIEESKRNIESTHNLPKEHIKEHDKEESKSTEKNNKFFFNNNLSENNKIITEESQNVLKQTNNKIKENDNNQNLSDYFDFALDQKTGVTMAEHQQKQQQEREEHISTLHSREYGEELLRLAKALSGRPINSFLELLQWTEPIHYTANQTYRLLVFPSLPCARVESRITSSLNNCLEEERCEHNEWEEEEEYEEEYLSQSEEKQHSVRLLVCHDMRGGYLPSDHAMFSVHIPSSKSSTLTTTSSLYVEPLHIIANAYTVNYWSYVDYFVYFSHHRVTIPPLEWIAAAHRNGVPMLGTLIVEGEAGMHEMNAILLSSASNMALVVRQLVRLCNYYHFDGYLLNFECNVDSSLISRVRLFVGVLREELNKQLSCNVCNDLSCNSANDDNSNNRNINSRIIHSNGNVTESKEDSKQRVKTEHTSCYRKRYVIWYDALTTKGNVHYQNALTALNKPFFDNANGILLNYFWTPEELLRTAECTSGNDERANVFVGIDVFGRHMYDGGQFRSVKSVHRAAKAGLSVGLFAPGWTLEMCNYGDTCIKNTNKTCNSLQMNMCKEPNSVEYYRHIRREFELREEKLWEPMTKFFKKRAHFLSSVNVAPEEQSTRQNSKFNYHIRKRQQHYKWLYTCFCDSIGMTFFINGISINRLSDVKRFLTHTVWCQRSAQHYIPPSSYTASRLSKKIIEQNQTHFNNISINCNTLEISNQSNTMSRKSSIFYLYSFSVQENIYSANMSSSGNITQYHVNNNVQRQMHFPNIVRKCVSAQWCETAAWFGNRSLRFTLAPMENAIISDWLIEHRVPWTRKIQYSSCMYSNSESINHNLNNEVDNADKDAAVVDTEYLQSANANTGNLRSNTKNQSNAVVIVDVMYKSNELMMMKREQEEEEEEEECSVKPERGLLIQLECSTERSKSLTTSIAESDVSERKCGAESKYAQIRVQEEKRSESITPCASNNKESIIKKEHKAVTIQLVEVLEGAEDRSRVIYSDKKWSLVRYLLPLTDIIANLKTESPLNEETFEHYENDNKVVIITTTAVAIVNKSTEHCLPCQIGGVDVTCISLMETVDKSTINCYENLFTIPSPLSVLNKYEWHAFRTYATETQQTFILELRQVSETVLNALNNSQYQERENNNCISEQENACQAENTTSKGESLQYNEVVLIAIIAIFANGNQMHKDLLEADTLETLRDKHRYTAYLGQHYIDIKEQQGNLIIPFTVNDSAYEVYAINFYIIEREEENTK